ncbi:MAG: hypothetical protein ACK41Z_06550 [Sediminibacterium sp.]
MEKIAIGLNLRLGTWVKRMWFELQNDADSKARFDSLCVNINRIDSSLEWKEFLQTVEKMFAANGFYRIAK